MTDSKAPIEGKVYAATLGAGVGTVASLLVWLLGVFVWGAPSAASSAADAAAAVPAPVVGFIMWILPPVGAFLGGYLARHTPRPLPEVDGVVEESDEPDAGDVVVDAP